MEWVAISSSRDLPGPEEAGSQGIRSMVRNNKIVLVEGKSLVTSERMVEGLC